MATHIPLPQVSNAPHDHDHNHEGGVECCSHHELKLERWIIVYLIGGVLVFTSTLCGWLNVDADIAQIPALIGALLLGMGLFYSAGKELLRGTWSSSTLAALAILAAISTGKYETAGYLAFILLVADQALRRTAWGARRAIEQLVQLTPDLARVIGADGSEREVPIGEVQVGTVVRVRAGENLPVDGTVTAGKSMINQASLTGEAAPVEVETGSTVYAGTTNLTGIIDLRATYVGQDSTIGKVAALINEAERTRTPRQLMIEQVARYFVPVALVTAALVWYVTKDIDKAITVLVVVCPSALLLSSPTAMMASFAAAARLGIMIKQTSYLEAASNIDTVVLDKTGTLTTGKFAVSRLAPAPGVDGAELLQAAADAEQHSNHPLARSIVDTAKQARIAPAQGGEFEEIHGHGVRGKTPTGVLVAGRASWLRELSPGSVADITEVESKIEGMTGVHVMRGGRYLGAVGLEDKLRYNAKSVVEQLRELGVRKTMVFTGDRFAVAKRVGTSVGVDQIEAECLPEEKHNLIQALVQGGSRVLMVGDGINDGPSLAAADVGVAMGLSGSDIATNSAGVALMNDDLSRIPFLITLARRTRLIIGQNIAASILIALIGLVTAATGTIGLGVAALYHFAGDIFVIANSFRLIRFGEEFASTQEQASASSVRATPLRPGARPTSAAIRQPATN